MSWTYHQSTGYLDDPEGVPAAQGYAGHGEGKNNPSMQAERNIGPLPTGRYTMLALVDSPHTGPDTIILEPHPDNEMFGRGEFRIHGDSVSDPGSASDGCIIMPRPTRIEVWHSTDHQLEVVA